MLTMAVYECNDYHTHTHVGHCNSMEWDVKVGIYDKEQEDLEHCVFIKTIFKTHTKNW